MFVPKDCGLGVSAPAFLLLLPLLKRRVPFKDSAEGLRLSRSAPKWCKVESAKAAAEVGENISSPSLFGFRFSFTLPAAAACCLGLGERAARVVVGATTGSCGFLAVVDCPMLQC